MSSDIEQPKIFETTKLQYAEYNGIMDDGYIPQTWVTLTPRGGGGGTLICSPYAGSGPASTVHPPPPKKKIPGISHTPQKYLNFSNPPKISIILYFALKKRP